LPVGLRVLLGGAYHEGCISHGDQANCNNEDHQHNDEDYSVRADFQKDAKVFLATDDH